MSKKKIFTVILLLIAAIALIVIAFMKQNTEDQELKQIQECENSGGTWDYVCPVDKGSCSGYCLYSDKE